MKLYHQQHGYHFETGLDQINELKKNGWVECQVIVPNEILDAQKDEVKTESAPQRGRPKAK
jgi:hypothetical protein